MTFSLSRLCKPLAASARSNPLMLKTLGIVLGGMALIGCQGFGHRINADGETLAASVIDGLPICYFDRKKPYVELINSSTELSRFYQTVSEQEDIVAGLPQVNFRQASVIVAGLGQKPSAGYQINYLRSNRIYRSDNHVDVTVAISEPATNSPVAAVITSPCVLIEVEKLADDKQIRLYDQKFTYLTQSK